MKISGQPPYFTKHELFARYPWLDDQLIDTCLSGCRFYIIRYGMPVAVWNQK